MNKYILVLAVLLVNACSAFSAADFKDFDTDKDDFISLEEAKTNDSLSNSFATLDVNVDGMISTTEFKSYNKDSDKS